jgi:exopolysaccharide biosynthesis polyprenyl glycosylphosphotransferase
METPVAAVSSHVSPLPAAPAPITARQGPSSSLARRALLVADLVGLLLAYLVAASLGSSASALSNLPLFVAFVATWPAWVLGARLYGLYDRDDRRPDHSTIDDFARVFQLITIGSWLTVAALWLFASARPTRAVLIFWLVAVIAVIGLRAVARCVVRRRSRFRQNTIIVGAGDVGQLVGRKLLQHPEFGVRLVGFVDSSPKAMRADLGELPVLGAPDEIVEIVAQNDVQRVVIAFTNDEHDRLNQLVRDLRDLDVQVDIVPRLFEAVGPIADVHAIEGMPLLGLAPARPSWLARKAKRVIDVAVAAFVLVLTAPLFALIAWRIKRDSEGPVFFRQERLGKNRRPFSLFKFRTMTTDTDDAPHREYIRRIMDPSAPPEENNLYKLERAAEVTKAGAWLRKTSLDELPQLINVLRGEMSLVGPRPCIAYELEHFEPHHLDRFLVPAGMTGLWQVAARAHSTFKEALDLDSAYARNWSLRLDLWLLARTPVVLVRGKETA